MSLSLSQYLLYLQYMLAGIAMTVVFGAVYLRITPVEELRLIKNGNLACALSFGGALVGFLSDAGFKYCPQRQLHRFYPVGPCRSRNSDFLSISLRQ